jgi:hypothetical protein
MRACKREDSELKLKWLSEQKEERIEWLNKNSKKFFFFESLQKYWSIIYFATYFSKQSPRVAGQPASLQVLR